MNLYKLIRPLLFQLDPEFAHQVVFSLSGAVQGFPPFLSLVEAHYRKEDPILRNTVFGVSFSSPVGVAAGFDKNGVLLKLIRALGFAFIEVGSISNEPCAGNPRPRLFRLPADEALINRMGLNNLGANEILSRIEKHPSQPEFAIGFNIVKTNDPRILGQAAIADIVDCYRKAQSSAAFIVLNVSCPNTEDGKTFEEPQSLRALLAAITAAKKREIPTPPVLLKFSPDTEPSQLEEVLSVGEEFGIDGYVLTNTMASRELGGGGLSGRPLKDTALERVRLAYRLTRGKKPIIGVGGIFSAEDAYQFIKTGASLVELYSGMIYEGPSIACRINAGLAKLLRSDGFKNVQDAIGVSNR